jgi:hypothetical protein
MTLRIVRGNPTPEETAAVTVVLLAAAGSTEKPVPKRRRWADPAYRLRAPLRPGPDAWIRSVQPR